MIANGWNWKWMRGYNFVVEKLQIKDRFNMHFTLETVNLCRLQRDRSWLWWTYTVEITLIYQLWIKQWLMLHFKGLKNCWWVHYTFLMLGSCSWGFDITDLYVNHQINQCRCVQTHTCFWHNQLDLFSEFQNTYKKTMQLAFVTEATFGHSFWDTGVLHAVHS